MVDGLPKIRHDCGLGLLVEVGLSDRLMLGSGLNVC